MKVIKRELIYRLPWVNADLKVVGITIVGFLLLVVFLFRSSVLAGSYQGPGLADAIVGLGMFLLICLVVAVPNILRSLQEKTPLVQGQRDIIGLEVLDRFTFIKMLPGKDGRLEFRYFIKTTAGNWQLSPNKQIFFNKLQPGMFIRAAVTKGEFSREIVDLKILSETIKAGPGALNRVVDKVGSEVKVTGYRSGSFLVNNTDLLKEVGYYLVINNQLLPVSGTAFSRATLNQPYPEGPE